MELPREQSDSVSGQSGDPAPSAGDAPFLDGVANLRLPKIALLATASATCVFVLLVLAGSTVTGVTGAVTQGALTGIAVAAALHRWSLAPLLSQFRRAVADAGQLRLDKAQLQADLAAANVEIARCATARDAESGRRQASEGEVRRLTAELEQRILQRTAELEAHVSLLRADLARQLDAAETLRESERRRRNMIESAAKGIWTLNAEGRTSFINRHGAELFGCDVSEILGRAAADVICVEDLPEEARSFDLRQGGYPDPMEFRIRHKQKGERWARASASCIVSEDGNYSGALILFEDVTAERARAAIQLRVQRLESATAMANGLTQELGNGLAAILLSAESLRPRLEPDDQKLAVAIQTSAERCAALLDDVLTSARGIEGERLFLEPSRILRSVAATLREVFPRDIQVVCEAADDLGNIQGDPAQLQQMLLRLCVNARDAMPNGGILRMRASKVRMDDASVNARLEIKPGEYVVFDIHDSGAQIPLALRKRVFEPFFKARERSVGTGLSLAAALGVARSHSGAIEFCGSPGGGSSFLVYIPRLVDSQGGGAIAGSRDLEGGGEVILLIEQETSLREAIQEALSRSGYTVVAAGNRSDALSALTEHRGEVRVILTDLSAPCLEAPALARAARELNSNVRIVAATAFSKSLGQTGKFAALQSIGIDRLLPRPCTLEELLQAIRCELGHPAPLKPQ